MAGQIFVMIYALLGIPLTGFFLRTVGNELTTLIAFVIKLYERRMLNRESEKLEIKCAAVSMVLALVMLVLGSAIFSATERSWEYDTAFYFCFVTLTTIGFGDFVPGAARDNFGMCCCVFYCFFFLFFIVQPWRLMGFPDNMFIIGCS